MVDETYSESLETSTSLGLLLPEKREDLFISRVNMRKNFRLIDKLFSIISAKLNLLKITLPLMKSYIAAEDQHSFMMDENSRYIVGKTLVFLNGKKLIESKEVTTINGEEIFIHTNIPIEEGDVIDFVGFSEVPFEPLT